jgi:hypothetical protein
MTETVDHEARAMAQLALQRQTGHEDLCTDRWSQARATMNKLMWILIGTLLAVVLSFVLPKPTLGHGMAQWVMLDAEASWCCGPRDCYPVPGRVYVTQAGWSVLGLEGAIRSGSRGYYERATPDNAPWACQTPDARLRCIIVPRGTS